MTRFTNAKSAAILRGAVVMAKQAAVPGASLYDECMALHDALEGSGLSSTNIIKLVLPDKAPVEPKHLAQLESLAVIIESYDGLPPVQLYKQLQLLSYFPP